MALNNRNFRKKGVSTPIKGKPIRARGFQKARGRKIFRRRYRSGETVKGAKNQLRRFTQASILAVALTGFLLLLFNPGEAGYMQEESLQQDTVQRVEEIPDSVAIIENIATEELLQADKEPEAKKAVPEEISEAAKDEALITITNLWEGFYANLPKMLVGIIALLIAWLLVRLLKAVMRRMIGHWKSGGAIITLTAISVWLLAIGLAISVLVGDIRALAGSLGLIGLALSWSLQTPIESFTGWLLNSFQGYYRVGDRISVGDVFGDVYKIDFLTTTVWEIGAPYRQGFVQAEQATGRLVTFPNNEILAGTVVNLTGDFPYVWDELAVAVANESQMRLALEVIQKVALNLLGDYMKEPIQQYSHILKKSGLNYKVADRPEVYVSIEESWTNIIIRYLVGARERRTWKSELSLRIMEELNKEAYKGKIIAVYPRQQVQFVNPAGEPIEAVWFENGDGREATTKRID